VIGVVMGNENVGQLIVIAVEIVDDRMCIPWVDHADSIATGFSYCPYIVV
jgi:hypothetical protein